MFGVLVTQQVTEAEQWSSIAWLIIKSLVAFAIVVYLAVVVTRLWVRKGAGILTGPKRHLQLLEHLPLGPGKGLFLIRVKDAVLLISLTDNEIKVLQEFAMSPEFEVPLAVSRPNWIENLLTQLKGRVASDHKASEQFSAPDDQSFAQELRQRLDKLKEHKS